MVTKTITGQGDAWAARAGELALWAQDRLVNRCDSWGAYRPDHEIGRVFTRPDGTTGNLGPQRTVRGLLTLARLVRHFRAKNRADILGLHTASAQNTSKGGALDIDHHGPTSTAPTLNENAALAWYNRLTGQGFRPLLTESNGDGGYHLRLLLADPVPAERVFWFLKLLTADHEALGFPKRPEQFPKQSDVRRCGKGLGNWIRLPGMHHKKNFWSRVWGGSRWLDGGEAIDHILALAGDPPGLIPLDVEWQVRVPAYLAKLPHGLGAGQGRDDVAFQLLAFLTRDLGLPDDYALDWAGRWDSLNNPPKGPAELLAILANVHLYAQRPRGSGLNGPPSGAAPGAPAAASPPPPAVRRPAVEIIRERLEVVLNPTVRRGDRLWSSTLRAEVTRSQALALVCDDVLREQLSEALEVARDDEGRPKRGSVTKTFRDEGAWAWGKVLRLVPDEPTAPTVDPTAEQHFRNQIAKALTRLVQLGVPRQAAGGRRSGKKARKVLQTETRSVLDWCLMFAKAGPWAQLRSWFVWCRLEGSGADRAKDLRVAIRYELLGQLGLKDLEALGQDGLAEMCERYQVGRRCRAGQGGQRAIELEPDWFLGLLEPPGPPDVAGTASGPGPP
jgi:hypothetical protein